MKVLLVIPRHDYGDPTRGASYEFTSWVDPLRSLGHDVEIFDTFDTGWVGEPEQVHRALIEHAEAFGPDVVLMMLMEHEVPMAAVADLRRRSVVVNWFADDTWRYFSYSRHIAHHFNLVVTTSERAALAYARLPGVRALVRPWGFNPLLFHPVSVELSHDVGFVGQRYGRRGLIVERLRSNGVDVVAMGGGWPDGRVAPEELAARFASTRINLNFLESSAGPFQRLGLRVRGATRADRAITRVVPPPRQLKARPFEITACGAFLLTNSAPELPGYYEPNREVAIYEGERDLLRKVRYYLEHEEERLHIAKAGLERSRSYDWGTVLSSVLDVCS